METLMKAHRVESDRSFSCHNPQFTGWKMSEWRNYISQKVFVIKRVWHACITRIHDKSTLNLLNAIVVLTWTINSISWWMSKNGESPVALFDVYHSYTHQRALPAFTPSFYLSEKWEWEWKFLEFNSLLNPGLELQ